MSKESAKANVKELEFQSIPKLLWKYFLPAFAGVIINSLYNIVDRIFIGQGVGSLALAGLSSIFPIMVIMMAFGMLVGMGAGVRISLNLGKKDFNRAEKVLGNAFVLMIIVSVLISIIGYSISSPMLSFFGVQDLTYTYAKDYLNIILGGAIFNILGYAINNLIRAEGSARIAMYSMLISAGLNIILDYFFIMEWGMGVKGAAYATVLSQVALTLWVILHFRSKRSVIKLQVGNMKLQKDIVWYILTIGFAPFMMQLAASAVFGIFNLQLVSYGNDLAVGAMGVIMSIAMLLVMTILAITMAMQPIIGFNYGARIYSRVKQTTVICMIAASLVSVLGFLVTNMYSEQIVLLFNKNDKELLQLGTEGLRIFLIGFPIVGFQIVIGNYFQSIGKAGTSALLSMMRQVIILIPLLFILPTNFGLKGVWMSAPISDVISAIIVTVFTINEFKKLNNLISKEK